MRLTELEPSFRIYLETTKGDPSIKPAGGDWGDDYPHTEIHKVDTFALAQGIWFLCPACFKKNNGPVGTHVVEVGFESRGLLPKQSSHSRSGEPSRWRATGTGYDDLTLEPSVDCGCWHGFVRNGEVTNA